MALFGLSYRITFICRWKFYTFLCDSVPSELCYDAIADKISVLFEIFSTSELRRCGERLLVLFCTAGLNSVVSSLCVTELTIALL
jgi:hypothetical protein